MQVPLEVGYRSQYESCPEVCGNTELPGLALNIDLQINYSDSATTIDQQRIEAYMDELDLSGLNLLHIGVGNSQLAERFHKRVNLIDGLTVCAAERECAVGKRIPNYRVYLLNKFSRQFVVTLSNKYDVIVDNNLGGFACCKFHFYLMLDNYVWALNRGGQILTDQRGMDWTLKDPRWRLSYADLLALGRKFPLNAKKVSDTVYSLEKTG